MKLHIDGTEAGGIYAGDAQNAPFAIFDEDSQQHIQEGFATREDAELARMEMAIDAVPSVRILLDVVKRIAFDASLPAQDMPHIAREALAMIGVRHA